MLTFNREVCLIRIGSRACRVRFQWSFSCNVGIAPANESRRYTCKVYSDWMTQSSRDTIKIYRKTSNSSRTLVGNKIVDHSDVVWASPGFNGLVRDNSMTRRETSKSWESVRLILAVMKMRSTQKMGQFRQTIWVTMNTKIYFTIPGPSVFVSYDQFHYQRSQITVSLKYKGIFILCLTFSKKPTYF